MAIISQRVDWKEINHVLGHSVITMGNFDGVHQGHACLLRHVAEEANRLKNTPDDKGPLIITFSPHPLKLFQPERKFILTPLEEKLACLRKLGFESILVIHFTREFANLSPEEFVRDIIYEKIRPQRIIIGHDFTFGKGGYGNFATLTELGQKYQFTVEKIEPYQNAGLVVSSSKIRRFLAQGDIATANQLLGRPYAMVGKVVEGRKRGRRLGFPTANLQPYGEVLMPRGVYATKTQIIEPLEDEPTLHLSVTNIGTNPTFQAHGEISVETYLEDFNMDIYGMDIRIEFFALLRSEQKFSEVDALIQQMKKDVQMSHQLLTQR
jgi:riboflavin kinase/FMN adenylyltransferase